MWFGGSNRSHISATDFLIQLGKDSADELREEIQEVINEKTTDVTKDVRERIVSLQALNRMFAVIMDSDMSSAEDKVDQEKLLLKQEVEAAGGFAWITEEREIENYVPQEIRTKHITALHPNLQEVIKSGKFENAYEYIGQGGSKQTCEKVPLARRIVRDANINLYVSDLLSQINGLVQFIRSANGLPNRKEE